jgi:hypothetical protein
MMDKGPRSKSAKQVPLVDVAQRVRTGVGIAWLSWWNEFMRPHSRTALNYHNAPR